MTPALLLAGLLAAPPTDAQLRDAVRGRFEATGRQVPPADAALDSAAREIARRALDRGLTDAGGLLRVTSAISRAGGWDPNPVAVLVRASADDLLPEVRRQLQPDEPVTGLGAAVVMGSAERGAAVVLLVRRRIELEPFARSHQAPPKTPQRLCGRLVPPLSSADVFITRPSGGVETVKMEPGPKGLCAALTFPTAGRHAVEVLARGPRGPEVAALLFVDVGAVGEAGDEWAPEPKDDAEARARLLVRINALRLQLGLAPVAADPALDGVAQAWAERLATENFFSHVAPDGSDLKARLAASGYRYASAGENLGASSGPLAAHFGIEHSPGHRKNLIEAGHRRLGVGLARRGDGLTVLVEVLASPLVADEVEADPLKALYAEIAAQRRRRGLKPLEVSAALEGLAQGHARAALAAELPKAQLPGQPSLHQRAFALLDDARAVSVDLYVSQTPELGAESKNLAAPGNTRVGVGLARGDSQKYGDGRYWIVVIYASTD
ncbi:MAG: CAP domain-containing protein [Myxococcota bacterium]